MPKIFNTNPLGILLATFAFFMLGYVFYGVLFVEQWMATNHLSEEIATAHATDLGLMLWIYGIAVTFIQVLGLAYVINHAGASKLMTCIKIGIMTAVLFGLPILAYDHVYAGKSLIGLEIDFAHVLIGYIISAAILSFFRGKDAI